MSTSKGSSKGSKWERTYKGALGAVPAERAYWVCTGTPRSRGRGGRPGRAGERLGATGSTGGAPAWAPPSPSPGSPGSFWGSHFLFFPGLRDSCHPAPKFFEKARH